MGEGDLMPRRLSYRARKHLSAMRLGEGNPMHGRSHDLSSRQKMSRVRTGKTWVFDLLSGETRCVAGNLLERLLREGWVRGRRF